MKTKLSNSKQCTAIILAAGKGVRMKSSLPKVLHNLRGKPLIYHVLREVASLSQYIKQIIVVTGYQNKFVEKEIKSFFKNDPTLKMYKGRIDFAYQTHQLGTAHAVMCTRNKIRHKNVLIMCGDAPLITKKTLQSFIKEYITQKNSSSVITADLNTDNDLGRIIRDERNNIKAIREKITLEPNNIPTEVNSGIYLFEKIILKNYIGKIEQNQTKKEYFLTDIIDLLYNDHKKIGSYRLEKNEEILGVNSLRDLYTADKIMQLRILNHFIDSGVKIFDLQTTFIDDGVKIAAGTVIYPFTFIENDVIIGANCSLGPFIRIRKGTHIHENVHLGNFVEINRSTINQHVTMKHFGYLGDTTIKSNVNIGAGTVVANFDGKHKNKTLIEKNAFIGSDSVLVAPVKIGTNAVTGAGSVVTKNVNPNTIVVGVPARILAKRKK